MTDLTLFATQDLTAAQTLSQQLFGRSDFFTQLGAFLSLVFQGLGLGLLISIPIGIGLSRIPKYATPFLSAFALLQTIPSLAFLGFCISVLAIVKTDLAIVVAIIYSLFPIILNTYTGIGQVDPRIRDAAKGMGLTGFQVLVQVELPLALPVILDGVRTGAVYAIGMITIAALAGAPGFGGYITAGITVGNISLILLGVVPILIITALLFLGLTGITMLAKRGGSLGLVLGAGLIALMASYGLTQVAVTKIAEQFSQPSTITGGLDETERVELSLGQTWERARDFGWQTFRFVSVVIRGIGLALLLGLPIGIVLTRFENLAQPVISALALIQTIPSLALLGLAIAILPLIGVNAAIFATVVYCLFPIVLNTSTGISQVDARTKDAAKGMGMTDWQVLTKVEIPLALPVIMAGVRTAAMYSIAMVTISTLVGARGLGEYVYTGIANEDGNIILIGVIPILALSFTVFWALGAIAWVADKKGSTGQLVSVVLIFAMSGYAIVEPWVRKPTDILIGTKDFAENRILGEMMKLLIEAEYPEANVELAPNLGDGFLRKSMITGLLDGYPEYTGTLLTSIDALQTKVPVTPEELEKLRKRGFLTEDDVTELQNIADQEEIIFEVVERGMKRKFRIEVLEPFGLNNTYAIVVRPEVAQQKNLEKISDLKAHPELKFNMNRAFIERQDGWKGLVAKYDLKFNTPPSKFIPSLMYRTIAPDSQDPPDAVVGFATDWQIAVYQLKILEDDKKYFPVYDAIPIFQDKILSRYPKIKSAVNKLGGLIDEPTMQELNKQVVVLKRNPTVVAQEFLETNKFLENTR
ncbi:MAG: glycine betaine ABC transporter substrate-binding protein [Gemmataceae bacterium]